MIRQIQQRSILFVLSLCMCSTVLAQKIDYLGLEELFGEPVTAIATGKPLRVSDAPLPVEIISHREIARSGALDIPQLLRRVAGVEVSRNFKGQVDVNIRGYNQPLSNRLLVLINGRQVYMDNIGITMWNALPVVMAEIKQIEIVKGPNTSLLGFNAASGVINIITFDPLSTDSDLLELRVGTQSHEEGNGILTVKPSDDMAIRISAGFTKTNGFERDIYVVPVSEANALDKSNANLTWAFQVNEDINLEAELGFANQVADTMFASGGNGIFDLETEHFRFAATFDTKKFGVVSAQAYQNQSNFFIDFRKFNSTFSPTSPIENVLKVLQLNSLKSLGPRHNLRLGLELRQNFLQGRTIGTEAGRFNNEIFAFNTMWDWQITDALHLTNAIRYDDWETSRDGGIPLTDTKLAIELVDYSRAESDISFNSSLVYQINNQTTTRLTIGKGLHIPSLAELSRSFIPNPVVENYGNPNLNTEENTTIEFGVNHRFSDNRTQLSLSVFQQRIENIIGQTVVPPGPSNAKADITFENLGESKSIGFESTLKGRLGVNFKWDINYSYITLDDKADLDAARDILFETNSPKHKLNVFCAYTKDRWTLDADIHYVDEIEYQAAVINFANPYVKKSVGNYVTLNLNLSYQLFEHTFVALHGYNLIDAHQERPAFLVGPTAAGGEELERAFIMSIRYQPAD